MASSIESAWAGLTEVEDSTASVRISFGSGRTLADISSILVDALSSGAAWVAQTLVQVDTLQDKIEFPLSATPFGRLTVCSWLSRGWRKAASYPTLQSFGGQIAKEA